jgi:hypothetical protein
MSLSETLFCIYFLFLPVILLDFHWPFKYMLKRLNKQKIMSRDGSYGRALTDSVKKCVIYVAATGRQGGLHLPIEQQELMADYKCTQDNSKPRVNFTFPQDSKSIWRTLPAHGITRVYGGFHLTEGPQKLKVNFT